MLKYLTISDDLQLIPNEGGGFLSKSDKRLEQVEYEVVWWLEEHPTHPMGPLVREWLNLTDEYHRQQKQTIITELAVRELEKSTRTVLFLKYRREGFSVADARDRATRNASAATAKFMEG